MRRGRDLLRAACACDIEGTLAKWAHGTYQHPGASTSWIKVKNPAYSRRSRISVENWC
jgi:ATP-dependent DNA ligase